MHVYMYDVGIYIVCSMCFPLQCSMYLEYVYDVGVCVTTICTMVVNFDQSDCSIRG